MLRPNQFFATEPKKGTIEDINKRIRRYLPNNTDLTRVSQAQLTALANNLNATTRKCLGFKTLAEVFATLLQEAISSDCIVGTVTLALTQT